ncbi:MAG: hypothetical protein JWP70_1836 [Leifsonia sp.]|nr:hypothetical protein [Leifsonia sp.]
MSTKTAAGPVDHSLGGTIELKDTTQEWLEHRSGRSNLSRIEVVEESSARPIHLYRIRLPDSVPSLLRHPRDSATGVDAALDLFGKASSFQIGNHSRRPRG